MRALPTVAQTYLIFIFLAGLLAVAGACVFPMPESHAEPWELGLFVALALLAGGKKIPLVSRRGAEDVAMSLGFAITFAAMLRFGPAAGLLVGGISSLSACLYPKRQPLHQLLFNVSLSAVEAWMGGMTFLTLNGGALGFHLVHTLAAVVASSLVFFLVNTGCIAVIVALCTRQSVVKLWRETFLWTAPSYFAGASISTLVMMLGGHNAGVILALGSPVAYLTYKTYETHMARISEQEEVYRTTIQSLALAIDAKDEYTHQHILRVQRYAMATARRLGLTGSELQGLEMGALLHDIGKLGIPEHILLKPGRLTDEEFAQIKRHPEIGGAILEPVAFPWPVLPVVKYHHEKWNGQGYPCGLRGEEIPLTARILAVADVYDALTSARPYRSAWPHEKALAVIKQDSGTHFDPAIVAAFLEIIDDVAAETGEEAQHWSASPAVPVRAAVAGTAPWAFQQAAAELWTLYEAAQTLSSGLGVAETLDILTRKMAAILPGAACLFLLRDDAGAGLRVEAAVGPDRDFFLGARSLSRGGRSLAVMASRQSYLGEYDSDDLLLISSPTAPWVPLQRAIIVPLVHQDEVLGTLNLYHPDAAALGPHDRQILESIAERAAAALYNGLLFDRARSQANTDPLTGLYTLSHLTSVVEERCRRRAAFSVLCLDLDSFKPINDNFGHGRGDAVLRDLAALLRENVRDVDVVARYGGDEFLIVLSGAGPAEAAVMAARLRQAVEDYDPGLVHERLGALRLGVSIGYACCPRDGADCASLLSAADAQMHRDKGEQKLARLVDRSRPVRPDSPTPTMTLAA